MTESMYCIYETTNLTNGMIYRGRTTMRAIENGYFGSSKDLKDDVYEGSHDYETKILSEHNTIEDAAKREKDIVNREWVDRQDTYNFRIGGTTGLFGSGSHHISYGKKHSIESRKRRRDMVLGERNPMYGRQHSEDSKRKTSESLKGRKQRRIDCEYCKKNVTLGIYSRYHRSGKCLTSN